MQQLVTLRCCHRYQCPSLAGKPLMMSDETFIRVKGSAKLLGVCPNKKVSREQIQTFFDAEAEAVDEDEDGWSDTELTDD